MLGEYDAGYENCINSMIKQMEDMQFCIDRLKNENVKMRELIQDYYIYQFYDDCFVCRYYDECQDKKDKLPFCIAPAYLSERTRDLGIEV